MSRPLLRAAAAAIVLAPLLALAIGGASAQLPPLTTPTTTTQPAPTTTTTATGPAPTTTTSTTAPNSTSSTSPLLPSASTTTTTPGETPGAGESGGSEPGVLGFSEEMPLPGDGGLPLDEAIAKFGIPDWAREKMNSYHRSGAKSTKPILEALQPLLAFGFTPEEVARVGLGKFPVAGEATFGDDWWYPRYIPEFHLHEGTDVFAARGTPIVAPVDGVLTMGEGPVGGLYTYITDPVTGTYYYFSHLDALPVVAPEQEITDPLEVARFTFRAGDQPVAYRVNVGDDIGTVGDSGNAKGGATHVHFEIHPDGGEAQNPKPTLDQWLAEAEAAVPDVLALYSVRGPKAVITTQRTRATGLGQFTAPDEPLADEILGVSAVGPGTGVQVVTEEVVRAVSRIDWDELRSPLARPMKELHSALTSLFEERS